MDKCSSPHLGPSVHVLKCFYEGYYYLGFGTVCFTQCPNFLGIRCISYRLTWVFFLFAPLFFHSSQWIPGSHLRRILAFPVLPLQWLDQCHGICLVPHFAPGQMPSPAVPASSQHSSSENSRPNALWQAGMCTVGHALCIYFKHNISVELQVDSLFTICFVQNQVRLFLTHKYLITLSRPHSGKRNTNNLHPFKPILNRWGLYRN